MDKYRQQLQILFSNKDLVVQVWCDQACNISEMLWIVLFCITVAHCTAVCSCLGVQVRRAKGDIVYGHSRVVRSAIYSALFAALHADVVC